MVVEHEEDCPPALMGEWLVAAGCELVVCQAWAGDDVPELGAGDGWLVLGGSMGAHDEAHHPWLAVVKQRIREAADDGTPLLGICLGHQLAADALGGQVEVNERGQQLGLLQVGWEAEAHLDPLMASVATPRRASHWNHDVVTRLPEGGRLLATAPGGEVQAARHAPTVWGVQWHPELDARVARQWVESEHDEDQVRRQERERVAAEIADAEAELVSAWRPLARSFAALVKR